MCPHKAKRRMPAVYHHVSVKARICGDTRRLRRLLYDVVASDRRGDLELNELDPGLFSRPNDRVPRLAVSGVHFFHSHFIRTHAVGSEP